MTRLDDYRSALLAAFPGISVAKLAEIANAAEPDFALFVIAHGLGPLWHERSGRDEFHQSRLSAEALYLAQEHALAEIDSVLEKGGIEYALIKGAASRLLLLENPALRACYDLDLLVRPEDRVKAAAVLVEKGYVASPAAHRIGVELLLSRRSVDIDLHWRLLREGRLRNDGTAEMLDRRRRVADVWVLSAEDALFTLLVHPAFSKHLAGWEMGLHRVVDIIDWLRSQSFDWENVRASLEENGVRTAAWATLRWVQLLAHPHTPAVLEGMISDVAPGRMRQWWLEWWLRNDLPGRLFTAHWVRLLGFSLFLHDSVGDAARAVIGRRRARNRRKADLADFEELSGQ